MTIQSLTGWQLHASALQPCGPYLSVSLKLHILLLFSHSVIFATPWTSAHQASLSFAVSQSLLKFISIELVMPSNHLTLGHPLLLLSSVFPSIRVFSNESALWIRWPKYWSFSFSISPSSEYPRLISSLMFHYFFHSKNCGFLYSKRIVQRLKAITKKLASHLSAVRSENTSLVAGADLKS